MTFTKEDPLACPLWKSLPLNSLSMIIMIIPFLFWIVKNGKGWFTRHSHPSFTPDALVRYEYNPTANYPGRKSMHALNTELLRPPLKKNYLTMHNVAPVHLVSKQGIFSFTPCMALRVAKSLAYNSFSNIFILSVHLSQLKAGNCAQDINYRYIIR